jgi:hypothetical protein
MLKTEFFHPDGADSTPRPSIYTITDPSIVAPINIIIQMMYLLPMAQLSVSSGNVQHKCGYEVPTYLSRIVGYGSRGSIWEIVILNATIVKISVKMICDLVARSSGGMTKATKFRLPIKKRGPK